MNWIEFRLKASIVETTTVQSSRADILVERYTAWLSVKKDVAKHNDAFLQLYRLQRVVSRFLRPPDTEALRHTKTYQCEYIPEKVVKTH